jgi:hypothetical protein
MKLMNRDSVTIRLRDCMDYDDAWGHAAGQEVFQRLLAVVQKHVGTTVFRVSLAGVKRTDASFPRESVIRLAKQLRKAKGFCLVDADDADLLDNWDAAAGKQEQPLLAYQVAGWRLLGPQPSEGLRALFSYMRDREAVTTSEACRALRLNAPNASNKLKALWEQGYVLRREGTAASGGLEYEYFVAR